MEVVAARPRKVVTAKGRSRAALNKVPDEILNDPELKLAMEVLPDNYNLEIPKVNLNKLKSLKVAKSKGDCVDVNGWWCD